MRNRLIISILCFSLLTTTLYFITTIFSSGPSLVTSSILYKSVVIDAGHGGIDTGTYHDNIYEKDINLCILQHLSKFLTESGYTVATTRSEDTALDKLNTISTSRHNRDLFQRAFIINNSNCEFFISLHVNSSVSSKAVGPVVYYNGRFPESKLLAQTIQDTLNTITFNDFTPPASSTKLGNFYILRKTSKPGVLVETGFMTNNSERELLTNPDYQKFIASKIFEGVESYYKDR